MRSLRWLLLVCGILCLPYTALADSCTLAATQGPYTLNVCLSPSLLRRQELRIPMKMFVNLHSSDNPTFETAPTIDISIHGARIVTKRNWRPNQQLSVRSMRGDLYSRARVVHCQPCTDSSFVIGIELYYPSSDWIWHK
jgi:hypothetical protein